MINTSLGTPGQERVKEFLELKQGGMAMNEYILKFEEGCEFVPYIARNDSERG